MVIVYRFWKWEKTDKDGNVLRDAEGTSILMDNAPNDVIKQHREYYEEQKAKGNPVSYDDVLKELNK